MLVRRLAFITLLLILVAAAYWYVAAPAAHGEEDVQHGMVTTPSQPVAPAKPSLRQNPPINKRCFKPARQLHPPVDLTRPSAEELTRALPVHIIKALQRHQAQSQRLQQRLEEIAMPPHLRRTRGTVEQLAQCNRKYAVVTVALGGYKWKSVAPCFKSFQDARDACTFMHAMVEPSLDEMAHRDQPGIVLEDVRAYTAAARQVAGAIAQRLRRMETLQVVITMLFAWWQRETYSGIIAADSRDMLFMSDPFSNLIKKYPFAGNGQEYAFLVAEEAFFREPGIEDGPSKRKNFRVRGFAGDTSQDLIANSTSVKGYHFTPVLNLGLVGGTPHAILDLMLLVLGIIQRATSHPFGFDQGALNIAVYLGLELADFPHRVMLLDGASGPYRHSYALTQPIKDPTTDFHLNCLGEVYSMVHQYDRTTDYWRFIKRYMGNPGAAAAAAANA